VSSCCVLALVSVKGRVDRPFFFTNTTIAMITNNTIAGTVTDMIRISVDGLVLVVDLSSIVGLRVDGLP